MGKGGSPAHGNIRVLTELQWIRLETNEARKQHMFDIIRRDLDRISDMESKMDAKVKSLK